MAKYIIKVNHDGVESETGEIWFELDSQNPDYVRVLRGERDDLCKLRNNLIGRIRRHEYGDRIMNGVISATDPKLLAKSMKRNFLLSFFYFGMMLIDLTISSYYGIVLNSPVSVVFAVLSTLLLICGVRYCENARRIGSATRGRVELEIVLHDTHQTTERLKNLKKVADRKLGF